MAEKPQTAPIKSPKGKTLAKVVQLHSGVDLMGSRTSANSRDSEIQVFDWGVRIISKKSKRVVRIYSANIKGLEEFPEEE